MTATILTDIEGTTSSISFVRDVLFPYARRALPGFVREHGGEPQPVGERFQLLAVAGGQPDIAAFLGEGFGGGGANALGGAGDQNALAAQMQIHGNSRLLGGDIGKVGEIGRRSARQRSTLQCSVAPECSLVHCKEMQ